jgi:hypothetical protein
MVSLSNVDSFGQLLASVCRDIRWQWKRRVALLLAVALLLFGMQLLEHLQAGRSLPRSLSEQTLQQERDSLRQLIARQQRGEAVAVQILQAKAHVASDLAGLAGEPAAWSVQGLISPTGFILFGLMLLQMFLAVFVCILSFSPSSLLQPWRKVLRISIRMLWPMARVLLLTFFASFLWIALLGILLARMDVLNDTAWRIFQICAVVLGYIAVVLAAPRVLLSPVFLLQEGGTSLAALHRSMDVTRGYGWKILWDILAFVSLLSLGVFAIFIAASVIVQNAATPLLFVESFLEAASVSFFSLFLAQLARTLQTHPLEDSERSMTLRETQAA